MAPSSDEDLRARLRSTLGLSSESRLSDEDIATHIEHGKKHLSDEVARRLDEGETLSFYGDSASVALEAFCMIRLQPHSRGGQGPPADWPETVSAMRHRDFQSDDLNFWRDRMIRALERV